MSLSEEITYTDRVSQIKEVRFAVLSPAKIRGQSVAEITTPITNLTDVAGTINDPRLGISDKNAANPVNHVSQLNIKYDPGHFGHLELAKPVITSSQAYKLIIKVLNSICYRCSKLKIPTEDLTLLSSIRSRKGKSRYIWVTEKAGSSTDPCSYCGAQSVRFSAARENKDQVFGINAVVKKTKISKAAKAAASAAAGEGAGGEGEGEGEDSGAMAGTLLTGSEDSALLKNFNAELAFYILKNISDQDCALLGLDPELSRPEWHIWTVMPIPPPSMRPSVETEDGLTSSDDLTNKLNEIVKTNQTLLKLLTEKGVTGKYTDPTKSCNPMGICPGTDSKIMEWWCFLQYHVATYIDNEISKVRQATNARSSRPLKTLRQRIKSKRGRIRRNLMGKRVNHSARSVITPDPNISIDQLRIPRKVAMTVTQPEKVTPYNIDFLTKLVHNGPYKYPGAVYVKEPVLTYNGQIKEQMKQLKHLRHEKHKLSIGSTVYRHYLDGDVVLFNRQPSLHKMSMMAHRVVVSEIGNTFGLNISVTSPYNADFDGDEMNMHGVRSPQTQAELMFLAAVPTQIVSPQASKPVMGLVQDSLLASYRYTSRDAREGQEGLLQRFRLPEVMEMLQWTNKYNGQLPDPDGYIDTEIHWHTDASGNSSSGVEPTPIREPYWTAQTIISYILPPLTYRAGKDTQIVNGNLSRDSMLGKKTVGKASNSIIHVVWNDYGPETTRHLFDNLMNLTNRWLLKGGFSIGFKDTQIDLGVQEQNEKIVHEQIKEVHRDFINEVHLGKYQNVSRKTIQEQFEMDLYSKLNQIRDVVQEKTYESIRPTNRIHNTVTSGSKGNQTNIVQIMAMLGQQGLDSGRVPDYFYRRSLPHFPKDCILPEAKGFITDSFIRGLNPPNYWAHAQSGRVGVISTSIKTAETGYIQRKLVKVEEDAMVTADGTVRNANNLILQYQYGDDGFDASHLKNNSIRPIVDKLPNMPTNMASFIFSSASYFVEQFSYLPTDDLQSLIFPTTYQQMLAGDASAKLTPDEVKDQLNKTEFAQLQSIRDLLREEVYPGLLPDEMKAPVSFEHLIRNIRNQIPATTTGGVSDLNPLTVYQRVEQLIGDLRTETSSFPEVSGYTFRVLEALLRTNLASKYLVSLGVTQVQFEMILERIFQKVTEAIVAPGEMVGSLSAQSIGEPTTQLSTARYERVLIYDSRATEQSRCLFVGQIGDWIDDLMDGKSTSDNSNALVDLGHGSQAMDMGSSRYMIMGVNQDQTVEWHPISQLSRHPANGQLIRVLTRSGREVVTTKSHSFLKKTLRGIEPIKGSDLVKGMRIPVTKHYSVPKCNTDGSNTGDCYIKEVYGIPVTEGLITGLAMYYAQGTSPNQVPSTVDPEASALAFHQLSSADYQMLQTAFNGEPAIQRELQQLQSESTDIEIEPNDSIVINGHSALHRLIKACNKAQNHQRRPNQQRELPSWLFGLEESQILRFLKVYMDRMAVFNRDNYTIQMNHPSQDFLQQSCLLLSVADIFAVQQPPKASGHGWHLSISAKYANAYLDKVGTDSTAHLESLKCLIRHDRNSSPRDYIDQIPGLGDHISQLAEDLDFKGRAYRRWRERSQIGRATLAKYHNLYHDELESRGLLKEGGSNHWAEQLKPLAQAVNGHVIWDEIVELESLSDPKELVYDLTIPGNETFLLQSGIFVHNTLNVFHSTGIGSKANVSRGVPRMKEILDLSKNPKTPSYNIHLKPEFLFHGIDKVTVDGDDEATTLLESQQKKVKENVQQVMSDLVYTTLRDVSSGVRIIPYSGPDDQPEGSRGSQQDAPTRQILTWMTSHPEWEEEYQAAEDGGFWLIHFNLDKSKMHHSKLQMDDLYLATHQAMVGLKEGTGKKKWGGIRFNYHYAQVTDQKWYFQVLVSPDSGLKGLDLETLRLLTKKLEQVKVKGIYGIEQAYSRLDDGRILELPDGTRITKNDPNFKKLKSIRDYRLIIDTNNVNMLNSMYELFNQPEVDYTRVYSNNIQEIMLVLGVEAARMVIIKEIVDLLEFAETFINHRHIELLVDIMTVQGYLVSVSRYGVNKSDNAPWSRASFEETASQIADASIFAQVDPMTGVTPNIMFGQFIRSGTNAFDVVLDEQMIENTVPPSQSTWEKLKIPTGTSQVEVVEEVDQYCQNQEDFQFEFAL